MIFEIILNLQSKVIQNDYFEHIKDVAVTACNPLKITSALKFEEIFGAAHIAQRAKWSARDFQLDLLLVVAAITAMIKDYLE